MACGTPVIATRYGAVPEVIEQGRSGVIVDSPRRAWRAAVEQAMTLIRRECRASATERFSPERMVRDYVAAYQRLLFDRLTTRSRTTSQAPAATSPMPASRAAVIGVRSTPEQAEPVDHHRRRHLADQRRGQDAGGAQRAAPSPAAWRRTPRPAGRRSGSTSAPSRGRWRRSRRPRTATITASARVPIRERDEGRLEGADRAAQVRVDRRLSRHQRAGENGQREGGIAIHPPEVRAGCRAVLHLTPMRRAWTLVS